MGSLLQKFGEWLAEKLSWLGEYIFSGVLSAFAWVLEQIPVPDFMSGSSNVLSSIPPGVAYFAGAMEVAFGMSVIISALVARFIIRRIFFLN
jgi:hypothetical protein